MQTGRAVIIWLTLAAAAVVLVLRFIALDAGSHSASDTLRPFALDAAAVAIVVAVVLALARRAR
jgi:hypothetical protein